MIFETRNDSKIDAAKLAIRINALPCDGVTISK